VTASTILGVGRHLPARVVDAAALGARLGVDAERLVRETGVERRRAVEPGQGPSELAAAAAGEALAAAGRTPADVDLIVFATTTPDMAFPGSGCFLQDRLGCRTVGALDVRAQDAGFLYALATADRFVRAGANACVLVAAAEIFSTALDYSPAGAAVSPYFGDGAGVVLVGAGAADGVRAVVLHNDPTDLERYWCEFPASRHYPARMEMPQYDAGRHFYRIDAPALHARAEPALAEVGGEALARAGVARDGVAAYLLAYLDPRVAERAAARAGLPAGRVVVAGREVGHVGAASLPIALADALADGRLARGDVVCCATFGAGLAWGAAVLQL